MSYLLLCLPPVGPVRPTMSETTALGAAMAAGAAEGVNVWSLSPGHLPHVTSEKFEPQINSDGEEPGGEPAGADAEVVPPGLNLLSVPHRERVPLRPMEESRPESHELGDHGAPLQRQRYVLAAPSV